MTPEVCILKILRAENNYLVRPPSIKPKVLCVPKLQDTQAGYNCK